MSEVAQSIESWIYQRDDGDEGDIYYAIHRADNYRFIGNIYSSKAHACLIAAAPDLLAACKLAVYRPEKYTPESLMRLSSQTRDALFAAIAKATGGK